MNFRLVVYYYLLWSVVQCVKTTLSDETASVKEQISSLVPGISEEVLVSRVTWAKINGILYKPKDAYLLCSLQHSDLPEPTLFFGCVLKK